MHAGTDAVLHEDVRVHEWRNEARDALIPRNAGAVSDGLRLPGGDLPVQLWFRYPLQMHTSELGLRLCTG